MRIKLGNSCRREREIALVMSIKELILTYLPWLLSLLTIYSAVLCGDKKAFGWTIGFINQGLWLTWIITSETWGMLPMNIVLAFIFAKNYFKWAAEEYPIIE